MDSCFIITYSKNNMFVDVINLLYRYNFFVRYTSNKKNQYKKIQKFHVNHFREVISILFMLLCFKFKIFNDYNPISIYYT